MKIIKAISFVLGSVVLAITASEHQQNKTNHTIINPAIKPIEKSWITIGTDAVNLVEQNPQLGINFTRKNIFKNSQQLVTKISIVEIASSQINTLSHFIHDNFNRCAGFIHHDSLEEAKKFAMGPEQPLSTQAVNYTLNNAEGVNALLAKLNRQNLTAMVNSLASFNNRYYNQTSGENAAKSIRDKWTSLAENRSDISVELYFHDFKQPSVIATINGTTNRDEIVIIGGHLDSINLSNPSNGRAPGADDNASGISVITETLSAMVKSGYKPARTVKLIGYAAEEVGLRGSKAIASEFKANNINVVGVVQFDMTGYHGTSAQDIVFMTDYTNDAQNKFLAKLVETYLPDISYGYDRCGYGCSDHASWNRKGYAASMPFESRKRDMNRKYHTSSDSIFDEAHAFKFAQLSVAFIAELAKGGTGDTSPPTDDDGSGDGDGGLDPIEETFSDLSFNKDEWKHYTFDLQQGYTQFNVQIAGGSGDVDLYVRKNTESTTSNYDCRPYKSGNSESCSFDAPAAGKWHVDLRGYSNASGVTLQINATP